MRRHRWHSSRCRGLFLPTTESEKRWTCSWQSVRKSMREFAQTRCCREYWGASSLHSTSKKLSSDDHERMHRRCWGSTATKISCRDKMRKSSNGPKLKRRRMFFCSFDRRSTYVCWTKIQPSPSKRSAVHPYRTRIGPSFVLTAIFSVEPTTRVNWNGHMTFTTLWEFSSTFNNIRLPSSLINLKWEKVLIDHYLSLFRSRTIRTDRWRKSWDMSADNQG